MSAQNGKVEPEQVLKGVLNNLMKSDPKTTLASTPMRRTTPTSAFSTPSRSFSSVKDDVTEDIQLQNPSFQQPHLKMEAEGGLKDSAKDVGEHTGDQDDKYFVRGGDSRVTEDSPRSALDDIPFKILPSAEVPTQVTAWNADSPGRDDKSAMGLSSLMSKEASPLRSTESSTGPRSLISTPPREQAHPSGTQPPLPPSYEGSPKLKRTLFTSEKPEKKESPTFVAARLPIDHLNEQLLSHAHHIQFNSQPVDTSQMTSVDNSHHNDTTLSASNLANGNTTFNNSQELADSMSPERSFAESAALTPPIRSSTKPPDISHRIATIRSSSSSSLTEEQDKQQSPHINFSARLQHLNQSLESGQAPHQVGSSNLTQHPGQSQPPRQPSPRQSPQPPSRQSPCVEQQTRQSPSSDRLSRPGQPSPRQSPNQSPQSRQPSLTVQPLASTTELPGQNRPVPESDELQMHQQASDMISYRNSTSDHLYPSVRSANPTPDVPQIIDTIEGPDQTRQCYDHTYNAASTRSTCSTPDCSQRSQQSMQPSPGSISNASFLRAERFTKAQNFIKRVRGNAVIDTDGKIPPKPPTGPPAAPQATQSPSDCTPVVSNQHRKLFSAAEEKKESEDWPSAAVKQVTKAVDHLKHFGESFIFDESPSKRTGSVDNDKPNGSNVHSRMSETQSDTSGHWWEKEENFHTEEDVGFNPLANGNVNNSGQKPHRPSSRSSPSPPPSMYRTLHSQDLVKPVAMELPRTSDLIVQPDLDNYVPDLIDDEEVAKNCAAPVNVSKSVGPASTKQPSADPSSVDSTNRAMAPMMRMRLPGAQDSVLMEDNEIPTPVTEARSEVKVDAESPPRHSVGFDVKESEKSPLTPDRSRRSKSSRSAKGRNRGSSTRRSSRRRRRRVKEGVFGISPQCEGSISFFFHNLIDRQCGQMLDEEASESSYSSGDSRDESDGETYGESTYKSDPTTPPRKAKKVDAGREKEGVSTHGDKRLVDMEKERKNTKNEEADKVRLRASELGKDQQPHQKEQQDISMQKFKQLILDEERSVERVKRRKNDASNIRNKSFIREFISELSTDGIKLMQHRRSHKQAFSRPIEVTAHLRLATETGTKGFCEPCLQFLAHDGIPVVSVDLFDVRSLEKATALQLQAYPLAVPGNSLLIRTNPGDFVFEAKREDDALRIVHGMRWLIARLSFNLIIGNVNVSCELLDVGRKAFKQRVGDSNRAKAMNDLANHLVDKSSVFPVS